jgi:hypothetical protein
MLQSVYADLNTAGIADVDLIRWQQLTAAIDRAILPSTKWAFERVREYQIAVPSSPQIKLLTLEKGVIDRMALI